MIDFRQPYFKSFLRFFCGFIVLNLAWAFLSPQARATEGEGSEKLIKNVCATCHKFKGKGESRFNLKAPDLMWAGSKFQRDWLIGWMTGKEPMLYSKSYRWDQTQQTEQHMTVSQNEAEGLADYFESHL